MANATVETSIVVEQVTLELSANEALTLLALLGTGNLSGRKHSNNPLHKDLYNVYKELSTVWPIDHSDRLSVDVFTNNGERINAWSVRQVPEW